MGQRNDFFGGDFEKQAEQMFRSTAKAGVKLAVFAVVANLVVAVVSVAAVAGAVYLVIKALR